ncbi:MAG: Sec-independent protein translocase protein TatB [Rhodobacteraceae bacterium]|nr:Sec-independent protein translocase protein TatB [Paracoccaceae bacterium]MCY4198079.1 Sec-independent protein translocase protein TatB [Paracoccaceae bacterium]
MLDIGWTELLLIGVVALIVVGPKDLPSMFRALGRITGRMRSMAREFQNAMNQAADETGVGDIAKDIRTATSARRLGIDKLEQSVGNIQNDLKEEYRSRFGVSRTTPSEAAKNQDGESTATEVTTASLAEGKEPQEKPQATSETDISEIGGDESPRR